MEANILGFEKSYTMYFFMKPWYLTSPRFALPKLKISRIEHNDYTKIENYFKQNLTSTTEKKTTTEKNFA